MKRLAFLILFLASRVSADCPLWTYPENHKLDSEINNLCSSIQNPIGNNAIYTSVIATTGTVKSFMVVGTTTNDNAPTYRVGEYISSVMSVGPWGPLSGAFGDLTSISLTAGDWDVTGQLYTTANGATVTNILVGISITSGNSGSGLVTGDSRMDGLGPTAATDMGISVNNVRFSVSATTTVYLKYFAVYSAAVPKAGGRISARRIR